MSLVNTNSTDIIKDDYENMLKQLFSINLDDDKEDEKKEVEKTDSNDYKKLFSSALEARKGEKVYINQIFNLMQQLSNDKEIDVKKIEKINTEMKKAQSQWIENCKNVGSNLVENKVSGEKTKTPNPKPDYIDESATKLQMEIEALRGKIKSSDDALSSNSSPDVTLLKEKVNEFKDSFESLTQTSLKLQKPVERRIEILQEKIENGQFIKLSQEALATLERIHFIVDKSTIEEKQVEQSKVNSNRETKLKNLDSTWKQVVSRMNDLTDRLNWYLYCVKCVEENKSLPFGVSYTTGFFDRELKSPFAKK